MNKIRRVGFAVFHLLVMLYASVLFFGTADRIVAQTLRDYRLEGVEKQTADILALHLDQRLVRIETILAGMDEHGNGWLSNLSTGGIGLLLARAAFEEVRRKRVKED